MSDRDTGMNWLSKITPPGMSKIFSKRDTPDNLWIKCPKSGEMVFHKDLEAGLFVTPAGHHMRIGPAWRFQFTFDGEYTELDTPEVPRDPLKFKDDKPYTSRLTAARKKTGRDDAMAIAVGRIGGLESVVLVQNFAFMGGSLGMAAGESFIKAAETALARKAPMIVFTAAGGARMQEAFLSLMQLAKTTSALVDLAAEKIPFISVLTDPTTGGVSASLAMLGDINIAEPGALIGFAGPRVIKQTVGQKLPVGFQSSQFLMEKGALDMIVDRRELRDTVTELIQILTHSKTKEKN